MTGKSYPSLRNIPQLNLRDEFEATCILVRTPSFRDALRARAKPIKTPMFDWHLGPESLLTHLVVRSVVGLESFVTFAVFYELGMRNLLTDELWRKVWSPDQLGRGMANSFYNKLPQLIPGQNGLHKADGALYQDVLEFYEKVRNPIFHGKEFDTIEAGLVMPCFWLLERVYAWIDSWHKPAPLPLLALVGEDARPTPATR